MDLDQVMRLVAEVDEAIREHPWMDFEIEEYRGGQLLVAGTLDPSTGPDKIKIRFRDVFALSLPTEWKSDTSKPVLTLLLGSEAVDANLRFGIEQGNALFRFVPEDFPPTAGCLVAARTIEWWRPVVSRKSAEVNEAQGQAPGGPEEQAGPL